MSAGSKMDPPVAKAESISDGNSDSEMEEGTAQEQVAAREWEYVRERAPADPRVSEEGGGGAAPGTSAETPRQPVVRQLCFCSPWGFTGMRKSTCSPWRTSRWSRWMLEEVVTLWETCSGAGSWQDLWREEPMLKVFWQHLSPCWSSLLLEDYTL
ncbi:hypothetical protein TURU_157090 [Turdus rufiventris]|nr:hypothetical protein TURU_157090 [Turdus rufiventris]